MYCYWGFGLHILSEMELPELLPFEFENQDVTIRLGKTPEILRGEDVVHKPGLSINQQEYLLHLFNIANYYANNGNEIIVDLLPEGDEKSVRLFLLCNALPALLHQRNLVLLHASGVLCKEGVALFCGRSGAGKSTLVAALQQKGYTMFTDDVCVLQQQADGRITVIPGYPVIKLWPDSFEKIGMEMAAEDKRIRPSLPKYATCYHDTFDITTQCVKQLFILENDNMATAVQLKRLTNMTAFFEVQKNAYMPEQMNVMKKRDIHFAMISALVKEIPVYKSQKGKDINTLAELLSLIEPQLM